MILRTSHRAEEGVKTVNVGGKPYDVVLDPEGENLFVTFKNPAENLSRISLTDFSVTTIHRADELQKMVSSERLRELYVLDLTDRL
jgi:DNA-binding beta-propeller fold protein YncE